MQTSLVALHELMTHRQKEDNEVGESVATMPIENSEELNVFEEKLDDKNYFDKTVCT